MAEEQSTIISWEKVKEQKITISVATLIIGVVTFYQFMGWSISWHEANFITQAQAEENNRVIENRLETLENKMDQQTKRLETHFDEFRLYAAVSRVSSLEQELDRHDRLEMQGQTTPESRMEHRRIEQELQKAKEYKRCVMNKRQNCHLLMDTR